jgi:hypothetical protein
MSSDAFFRALEDDRFEATQWARGPWSPKHQHAGPPSALVAGRLAEMIDESFRVVRVAIEVTRPVPITTLRLERSFRREGRSVRAMTGRLFDDAGKLVLSADALAISEAALDLGPEQPAMDEPTPSDSEPVDFPFKDSEPGYANAMELRFGRGAFGDGDAMAWMRMRVSLLEGKEPSPLERVLVAADSGNGVSQRLNIREFTYVNPDLTVTVHRPLVGEWVGMAARTDLDDLGIGVADTRLYDETGPIGRGIQTLLIRRRR